MSNAIQRTVIYDREAEFGEGIADWTSLSANGAVLFVTDLTVEPATEMIEDANNRRWADNEYPMIRGLRSGSSFGFSMYYYGDPDPDATAGEQGTRLGRDDILLAALGGESVGSAGAIAAGTASAPTVGSGDLDGTEPYTFAFFYDTSEGQGHFRQVASITTNTTVNLAEGHVLPFTPASGDVVYACSNHWPNFFVIEDIAHTDHISGSMMFYGRHPEDVYELRGCAFGIGAFTYEAGQPLRIQITGKASDFVPVEDNTRPAVGGPTSGHHGPVVGSGCGTYMLIADSGPDEADRQDLAEQQFVGQVQVTIGIEPDPIMGPNGCQGTHGFGITEGSYTATGVTLTVPFSDSWYADFRAGTEKHLLVQVGDQPALAHGIYFPRLGWAAEPARTVVNGRVYLALSFKALEHQITAGTDAAASRARAKFYLFRTASAPA